MADNRKTRAQKNILTSLTGQIVVLLCGLVVPRLMIGAFGSEAYGATSSITQFLAYVTLLEGGVGGVARAVLYKPLARKDMAAISAVMEEVKAFFRVIGWIFAGYVLLLACCFPSISHMECMDRITGFALVIVISISSFGQYFIGISHSILLQAAQKTYITNLVSMAATVINALSTVVLIRCGCSLITVKLVSSCIFFLRPVVLWLYVSRHYSLEINRSEGRERYLTQKWSGLGQHIAFFLHSNTDIAVLTILTDLKTVAVYAVYNMIVSHMQSLTISFCSGMESVFGDMLASNEHRQLHDTFRTYETILSVVTLILFSAAAVLLIPFIRIYTAGITDTDYMQPLFGLLMVLTAISYCLRMPYHALVMAAGHFKQTSAAAYGEAVLNIGFSLLLVSRYRLVGVAAATLAATWFRFLYYVIYLSRHIFCRKVTVFLKRFTVNSAVFVCNCLAGSFVVLRFDMRNYLLWAVCGVVLVALMGVITLGINLVFFRSDCSQFLRKLQK